MRYLLIRALAHHDLLDDLRIAVTEYVGREHSSGNLELAFYAAKAGMPVSEISSIAGLVEAPKTSSPDHLSRSDPVLMHYAYAFVVLGYENDESSYANLCETVGTAQTLWNSALRHLLKAGYCIGQSFRPDVSDWYEEACKSIDILVNAKQGDGEKIFESIDIIRDVLQLTISSLTKGIQKHFPDRLDAWIERLASLRNSLLWNTHFGIDESIQDYDFELRLWENLATHSMVRPKLASILRSCAATYEKSTMLKGGSRSNHFVWLAAIMAKCGMRQDAEKWLRYGIRSSLIYGYHKDVALLNLIDVLKLVNQQQPDMALERCARVLWMVAWMPHLTDGRETKWFTQRAFSAVLAVNRRAAFDLLKHLSRSTARWKVQNCLEEYLLSSVDGDPEYLWCLSESFSNYSSDDGRHCKQIIGTRQHIVGLVCESYPKDVQRTFQNLFKHFVLTEITPRHWPDPFKQEFSVPPYSDSNNETDAASTDHLRSDFMLDGETTTREGIIKKCRNSFSEFLTVFEKLKAQNEYFYERDLIDVILRHYITEANSTEDLIPIKEYVESQGRLQDQNVIEYLANCFLRFGDQDNATACFALAYTCYGGWFPWQSNTKYLAAIARRDRKVAETYLLKECYDSAVASQGGYAVPPTAATGLDVFDEPSMLEAVFKDFLTHCESMFAQLPQDNDYAWMKEYTEPTLNENQRILQFSIEELDTPEIDHGERLVRALTRLAIIRPQSAIPLLVSRTLSASGRRLRRLLMILYTLATQSPDLLASHQETLATLLDREDFLSRQSVARILQCASKNSELEASVDTALKRIDRKYSGSISHSTYRMPSSPTSTFLAFLKRNTLFDFWNRLRLLEEILEVPQGSLVATIQERLNAQNWSMDEERSRLKDDWYEYVHPQGWPVVWITTRFHELATEVLWSILNEAAEKLTLSHDQIHWLWQTVQIVDPEYVVRGTLPRPADIEALHVVDREAWIRELDEIESFEIGNAGTEEQGTAWITVFEKRMLAHEERYNISYKQGISLTATLIPLQVYGGSHELDRLELTTEPIMPASALSVTLEQARDVLTKRGLDAFDIRKDCIPLIAEHQNPISFFGYRSVCTLASFIIEEFNLSFEGFDLTRDGKVVAKYEAWQEGYQDNSYTRDKLSFGVRFRVRSDFLAEICRHYRRMLCAGIHEKRESYKPFCDKNPEVRKDSKRYVIYHL